LEGVVEISDFEPEAVKNFLIFIYMGMVGDDKWIPDLYLLADKVRIQKSNFTNQI
jgi:hypothetical protein